jgi:hypothetical protein
MQHLAANDGGWRFEIAAGPNSGANVILAPGRYRLGSDAGNDIVLADPDVASQHAAMELAHDRASITVLAPGVLMQRRRLDRGRQYPLKPGTILTLGTTRLRVSFPPGLPRRYRGGNIAMCVAALAAACTGAAYYVAAPVAIGTVRASQPVIGSASMTMLTRAAADFRAHLADTQVAPDVQVTASDGIVLATGTILPADRPAWLDAEKWFDAHLGGHIALADRVGTAGPAELPKLDVAAVSMAPVPNVMTRDGEHYTVGAVLQNGWRIDRIAPNSIILRNGAREMHVTL